jgi:broad specificity phosphatase PhoE
MNVYLIRHAQSENNLLKLFTRMSAKEYNEILHQAHAAVLIEKGIQQAQAIGGQLYHAHIERVYSSPLPSATFHSPSSPMAYAPTRFFQRGAFRFSQTSL